MADYYTNFSVVLPLTKQQQAYAFEIAKQAEGHHTKELPTDFPNMLVDELENWGFETEVTEKGIWLHSQQPVFLATRLDRCVVVKFLFEPFHHFTKFWRINLALIFPILFQKIIPFNYASDQTVVFKLLRIFLPLILTFPK